MRVFMRLFFILLVLVSLFACTTKHTAIPVMTRYAAVQSSTQQDVLAQAAEKAVNAIAFPPGNGQRMACSLVAVLPQPDDDINDYIRAQVESRLAMAGWRVDAHPNPATDARCVISVASAGATVEFVQDELSAGRVAGNVFLQFPTLFTSWIWLPIYPVKRFYVSQVRLQVHLLPQADTVTAFSAEGQGSVRIHYAGQDHTHFPVVEGAAFRDVAERKVDRERE